MPYPFPGTPALFAHVGKGTITVVTVEPVSQRRLGVVEIAPPTVHKIDIPPAIIVEIEERTACARGFGQIVFWGTSVDVPP
jgi:hypothetical protein